MIHKLIKSLRKQGMHELADSIQSRQGTPAPPLGSRDHYMTKGALHDAWAWQVIVNTRLQDKLDMAAQTLLDRLHGHDCTCGPCERIRDTLAELEKTE